MWWSRGTCGIFRLTTVYSSMAGHGGIWLMLCVYQYTGSMATGQHGIPSEQDSTAGRKHGIPMQQGVYMCMICEHSIPPPSPELRNAWVRVSRACVRILLYYYNIIILLYYYIYIYPIYPVYPVYQYTKYIQQW